VLLALLLRLCWPVFGFREEYSRKAGT